MIQSPLLRAILVIVLLLFGAYCVEIAWTEGGRVALVSIVMALFALTFAVGLLLPGRNRIALRIVAGGVVLFYLVYFGAELLAFIRGERPPLRPGQPSVGMAALGLLIWGVPMLVYALSGRSIREHASARAQAERPSDEELDAATMHALEARGVELTVPLALTFYIELPSEGHARSAENVLRRGGYAAEVSAPSEDGRPWLCEVNVEMVPDLAEISALRQRLLGLVSGFSGRIDGWGAAAIDWAP